MGTFTKWCTLLLTLMTQEVFYTIGQSPCGLKGDVRLEDKEGEYVGRVGLCYRGQWGSVSGDNISDNVALVLCRQLGLPLHDPKVVVEYSGARGPAHLTRVHCRGNETNLLQCPHDEPQPSREPGTYYGLDIGVSCAPPCNHSEVRLVRNRVQICSNQFWMYMCWYEAWTDSNAHVMCRKLGYSSNSVAASYEQYILHQTVFPTISKFYNCSGLETHLQDCPLSRDDDILCTEHLTAKVYCSGIEICSGGERLRFNRFEARGVHGDIGRLEMCSNGRWGSICANSLTISDIRSTIACRELGYSNVLKAKFTPIGIYDRVTLPEIPIVLDEIECVGNEASLLECQRSTTHHGCVNWEDAVLQCRVAECNGSDIRLIRGRDTLQGVVQICHNQLWATVCDGFWSYLEAQTVCQQLGHTGRSYALREYSSSRVKEDIASSNCHQVEESLSSCTNIEEDYFCVIEAAVLCTDDGVCSENEVRLVGGHSVKEGQVQICQQGHWHSVCADGWTSDGTEASVICSQLGYSRKNGIIADFGRELSRPVSLLNIQCNGSELTLSNCNISSRNSPDQCLTMAGIICEAQCGVHRTSSSSNICSEQTQCPKHGACCCSINCFESGNCCPDVHHLLTCFDHDGCETGEVRLTGGVPKSSSGVVEVCVDGVWGLVCDYSFEWSHENAKVVCRQLNLPTSSARRPHSPMFPIAPNRPILFDSVQCNGSESHLLDCLHSSVGNHICNHFTAPAVVQCKADCVDNEVRLTGGVSSSTGHVEICRHGVWGIVCGERGWNNTEAMVVCRQLGFNITNVKVTNVFGRGSGPVLMSGVSCSGSEFQLYQCNHNDIDRNCNSAAGVICINQLEAPSEVRINYEGSSVLVTWRSVAGAEWYTITFTQTEDNQMGTSCHDQMIHRVSMETTNSSIVVKIDRELLRVSYTVSVTAGSNLLDTSKQSQPFKFTSSQRGASVAPRNVRGWAIGPRAIRVYWDGLAPCSSMNGLIVGYTVEYRVESINLVDSVYQSGVWNITGAEISLTKLVPFTNYSVSVAAVNDHGDVGVYSHPILIQTMEDVPGPVESIRPQPSLHQILLIWDPPEVTNGVIISYEVSYWAEDTSSPSTKSNTTITSFVTESTMDIETNYLFSVRAYTRAGPGNSTTLLVSTLPRPPAVDRVRVVVVGTGKVNVSWDAAITLFHDIPLDHYTVATMADYEDTVKQNSVDHHSTYIIIEDINTASLYEFQVFAVFVVNDTRVESRGSTPVQFHVGFPESDSAGSQSSIDNSTPVTIAVLTIIAVIVVCATLGVISCIKLKKKRSRRNTQKRHNVVNTEHNPAYGVTPRHPNRKKMADGETKMEDRPADKVTATMVNSAAGSKPATPANASKPATPASSDKPATGKPEEIVYETIPM